MLKLKRIQIQGFKSFADKMELTFEGSGITGIVGPNGCGKSNVSDAIAWVLGEQSAKSLRGGRMEDVIFNGTRSRLPLGLAEVALTLIDPEVSKEANSISSAAEDSAIPSHEQSELEQEPFETEEIQPTMAPADDASGTTTTSVAVATKRKRRPRFQPKPGELVVSRRLFRSGDSEYLLNGRQVRLRDVQDIFLGTGLGPGSYAIIEQGRVGMILSSKPSDRRSIIEEAAGVTKFKSKRKLAESKLEQARNNLLRVNDITEEVSKQLGSLKRQAAKTRRYGEVREQMRQVSKNLFNARAVLLNKLLTQGGQELQVLGERLQFKQQEIQNEQLRYRETNNDIFNLESELKGMREQLSQLTIDADRGNQRILFQKEQLKELELRIVENSSEIERLLLQQNQHQQDCNQKQQSLVEATEQFNRVQQDFLSQNSSYQAIQTQVQDLESSNESHRLQLLTCVDKAATVRNQLQQLGELELRLESQLRRLYQDRDEAALARLGLTEEKECADRQQREEERQLSVLKQELMGLGTSVTELKAGAAVNLDNLSANKDRFSEATHRLKSLEELATHHAYNTEAVRILLSSSHADSAAGFSTPGILADLIEVESPYELVVEEFLKQELEYLLVKDEAGVRAGLDLLRNTGSGRSTFLLYGDAIVVNSTTYGTRNDEILQFDSTLVPLKRILRISPDVINAVEEALPHLSCTFIGSSYEQACKMARQFPQVIVLSPSGEIVRGRLTSGGGKGTVGHLSLKREIRELQRTTEPLQRLVQEQQEKQEMMVQQITFQEEALESVRQRVQELEKDLFATDLRGKQITNEFDKLSQRQQLASLELQRTELEKAQSKARASSYQEEIALADNERIVLEEQISQQSDALKQLKEKSAQEAANLGELRSELATFRERKQAAESDLARLSSNIRDCEERSQRLNDQKNSWTSQTGDIESSIRNAEESLFHQAVQKASLEAEIRSKETALVDLRSLQNVVEQGLQQHRAELDEIQTMKTEHEIERARLESDLAHLQETCKKELGMSLAEIQPDTPSIEQESEFDRLTEEYQSLKEKIEAMGPVNMMAMEEYQECEQRFHFLTTQRQDLLDSIEDTGAAIKEIDLVSREQFREAFTAINANFQESFRTLFGGGYGEMKLLDAGDELESGIEITAQPPGKKLQNVLLLSGGEKALTAIALLLAIFKFQPSPFCVLDEVDAPLDEVNTGRYAQMIKAMSLETQFLLITHSKRTMEVADSLYGVTMQEAGVSKVVSVNFQ